MARKDHVGVRKGRVGSDPTGHEPVLLEVRGVSKAYGGVQAVNNVSFRLERGEILGVVGPNGAGKTSLVDVLAGVQPGDSGDVIINATRAKLGIAARARMGLSRTFQHPQVAHELTVGENVALGHLRERGPAGWSGMFGWFLRALVRGDQSKLEVSSQGSGADADGHLKSRRAPHDHAWQEIQALLPESLLETRMQNVSYGTEKLSEVARAVISDPDIILMDEPFAGLDSDSIEAVCCVLKQLAAKGVGLVVVDHNLDILQVLCTRIIVLDQGEKIADDDPEVVLQSERVQVAYFGEAGRRVSRDHP